MARDFFDSPRVAANKTAATVLYGKGVEFKTTKKIVQRHWENQPPTVCFRGPKKDNLTGTRFGRFRVVGAGDAETE